MWLLLLALPLQGFAAASMVSCGPNHERMMSASAAHATEADVHAAAGHHQHAMNDATGGHHDHHETVADTASTDLSSVHHLDKLSKFKCSACAACCMGAAMPTTALVVPVFPPAMTTATFVSTPHVDFVSGGLDRPPRPLLA